jgi:RHS repeat-associated protein
LAQTASIRCQPPTHPEGLTLFFQTVSFPAIGNVPGLNLTQSYTYDQLGRLKTAGEGTGSWAQTYGYTNGNRYVSANSGFSLSASTPTVASNFDSNNRLQVNGAAYDNGQPSGNGNQTAIGGYTYTYDAENRMVSAVLNAGATLVSSAGYVYDGAGQRVQKMTCWSSVPCTLSSSDATITTYVYDAFGNLAQEYGPYLNAWCATPTCYLTQDQIGSTRMVTDANGLVGTRYDFLPFGEEVPAGTGGRTLSMGYNGWEDNSNPKFAGQMRDPESARDLMGFRYYSPQEGRFVSVDPGNAGADSGDPQTWNGYSYVGNNPLNLTDPAGLGFWSGFIDFWETLGSILGTAVGIGTGGINNAPWNEQIPITPGNAGDPLNLGGVFGGGDVGGGIFSELPANGISVGIPSPTPTFSSYWNFFWAWVSGRAPQRIYYSKSTIATQDMMRSGKMRQVRQDYINQACPAQAGFNQGHVQAYADSAKGWASLNPNYTESQVGGYYGKIASNDVMTTYTIFNTAGISSFVGESAVGPKIPFLNLKGNELDNLFGQNGPSHNVVQQFVFTEPNPCHP